MQFSGLLFSFCSRELSDLGYLKLNHNISSEVIWNCNTTIADYILMINMYKEEFTKL